MKGTSARTVNILNKLDDTKEKEIKKNYVDTCPTKSERVSQ